jgi:thiosulfate dehydrogenase (quinone) large subunit
MAPLIAIGEVVIGAALLLGAFTAIAAFFGGVLTMAFGMAGVAGVNPVFFLAEVLLILAWRNAGYIGLDRFLLPKLGTPWHPGTMFRGDRPPMDERTAPDTEAGP